jgi:hypothetical protein
VIGVFVLIAMFFAKNAGTTGGEIRHSEIRSGATVQNAEQGASENEKGKNTEEQEDED